MNSNRNYLVLSLFSGALFRLGWPVLPIPVVLFLAFVPLLIIQDSIHEDLRPNKGRRFFTYSYVAILIWNITTTWWICNATLPAGIFTLVVNSALMTLPLLAFHWTRSNTGDMLGYLSFIIYFLAFEYFHLNWDLSWPWLTLGNAFASLPQIVQWYEFTGVFGGSLWILSSNLLLFFIWKYYHRNASIRRWVLFSTAVIGFPILLSLWMYNTYVPLGKATKVTVIQPNIDPYHEKYQQSSLAQVEKLLQLSTQATDRTTEFVLWPETSIPFYAEESVLEGQQEIVKVKQFVDSRPRLSLLAGMDSYGYTADSSSSAARLDSYSNRYYETYNAALFVGKQSGLGVYHKSKLVPGVEKLPYPKVFGLLTRSLGEFVGTLGTQQERTVFFNRAGKGIAPVICYESIFGDFLRGYMKNGAQAIGVITNDGWWGDTEGYRQHLMYARLRAIEFRKEVARSANTGVSCFIDQRGDIREQTKYWTAATKTSVMLFNSNSTLYVLLGDAIGWLACWLAGMVWLITFMKRWINL